MTSEAKFPGSHQVPGSSRNARQDKFRFPPYRGGTGNLSDAEREPRITTRQAAAETAAAGFAGWAEIARPNSQPTPAGVTAYATARKLDKLAQWPLERLAEFFPCPQCSAPAGGPCDGAEDPEAIDRALEQLRAINRAPDVCAARLEDAAAARAEWLALRSPDGRAWARVWDRRVARSAARSALWKAAQGLEGAETNDTRPDDREGQQTAAEAEEMDR